MVIHENVTTRRNTFLAICYHQLTFQLYNEVITILMPTAKATQDPGNRRAQHRDVNRAQYRPMLYSAVTTLWLTRIFSKFHVECSCWRADAKFSFIIVWNTVECFHFSDSPRSQRALFSNHNCSVRVKQSGVVLNCLIKFDSHYL